MENIFFIKNAKIFKKWKIDFLEKNKKFQKWKILFLKNAKISKKKNGKCFFKEKMLTFSKNGKIVFLEKFNAKISDFGSIPISNDHKRYNSCAISIICSLLKRS